MSNKVTKKDFLKLSENYISKKINYLVDEFLFNNAHILGFTSMDVLNFINGGDENINTITKLSIPLLDIKDVNELKSHPNTLEIIKLLNSQR